MSPDELDIRKVIEEAESPHDLIEPMLDFIQRMGGDEQSETFISDIYRPMQDRPTTPKDIAIFRQAMFTIVDNLEGRKVKSKGSQPYTRSIKEEVKQSRGFEKSQLDDYDIEVQEQKERELPIEEDPRDEEIPTENQEDAIRAERQEEEIESAETTTKSEFEIRTFEGHEAEVYSVAFSPNGKYALTAGNDYSAKLWDVQSGEELRSFYGHDGTISSACFSPDGKYVLTGSADATVRLWDIETGETTQPFRVESPVLSVSFSPNGGQILALSEDKTIKIWDTQSGELLVQMGNENLPISAAIFSSQEEILIGSENGNLERIKYLDGERIWKIDQQAPFVSALAVSKDASSFLAGYENGVVKLLNAQNGQELLSFPAHDSLITSLAFSPDGKSFGTSSVDHTFKIRKVSTGEELRTFLNHEGAVRAIAFSPDGGFVLSGSDDKTVKLWEAPVVFDFQDTFIANTAPPGTSGEDQLEIMPDVKAFARLIASRVLVPPLSIGLFGDWGSGKSFFMEKLFEEVKENTHISKKTIEDERRRIEGLVQNTQEVDKLKEEILSISPDAKSQAKQIKNWIEHRDSWGLDELRKIFGDNNESITKWACRFQGKFESGISPEELDRKRGFSIKEIIDDAETELEKEIEIYRGNRADEFAKALTGESEVSISQEEAEKTVFAYAETHGRLLTPFHSNIAQIKFNAWHYIDTNLWASLMVRVFEALNRFVGNLTADEQERIDLYKSLSLTAQLTAEKEREIEQIDHKIDNIKQQLGELEAKRLAHLDDFNINAKEVWQIVKRKEYYHTFHNHIKQTLIANSDAVGVNVEEEVENLEKKLMGEEIFNQLKQSQSATTSDPASEKEVPPELVRLNIARHKNAVMDLIGDMQSNKSKVGEYWTYLKELPPKQKWWYFLFLVLAILGTVGVIAINTLEGMEFPLIKNFTVQAVAVVGSAIPFLTKFIDTANHSLTKVNKVYSFLDSAKDDLETLKDRATQEIDAEIALKHQHILEAQAEKARLEAEKNDLERQQQELQATKEEMESGQQLAAYLEQRLEDADYQKHLGLISTVREDLEKLTNYLHKRGNHSRIVLQMTDNPTEEEDSPFGVQRVHTVDRIVLYIDDLDRCPPDKVVDVLQAIHLLLAFPLFVVVVGVDVRWISRSLLKKYGGMLGGQNKHLPQSTSKEQFVFDKEASPYDYLEKIFQIPFRLKTMEDNDKFKYVKYLILGDQAEEKAKVALEEKQEETKTNVEDEQIKEESPSAVEKGGLDKILTGEKEFVDASGSRGVDTSIDTEKTSGDITSSEQIQDTDVIETIKTPRTDLIPTTNEQAQKILRHRQSYFDKNERILLEVLSPILSGKPRTVKRFINVCRLIKSHDIHGFEGAKSGGDNLSKFDKITFALAMVTGLPELVRLWLEWAKLPDTKDKISGNLVDFIEKDYEKIMEQVSIPNKKLTLEELNRMKSFLHPEMKTVAKNNPQHEKIQKVGDETTAFLDKLKAVEIESFQEYLEIASRYSFRFSRY